MPLSQKGPGIDSSRALASLALLRSPGARAQGVVCLEGVLGPELP